MNQALENLVKIGQLKAEPADARESIGLLQSAIDRLRDAHNTGLSLASRFDLAYNATHALALWALRQQGYRSDKRYLVFQCLSHTLNLEASKVRMLDICHNRRNLAEYEGFLDINEALLLELIAIADAILHTLQNTLPQE